VSAQEKFYRTLNIYYKRERDRTEDCLGDIIKLLESEPDESLRDAICNRLVAHYSRNDAALPLSEEGMKP
jgi:hypothetical protein